MDKIERFVDDPEAPLYLTGDFNNAYVEKYSTIDNDYGLPYISDHYPILGEFLQS